MRRYPLDQCPMRLRQWCIVALCALLNALDGYDVLSISLAAPGIARDWGLLPTALGVVLSIELIGMALGAIALGRIADSVGRRPVLVAATALVAVGMGAAAMAPGVFWLGVFRFVTGLGLGGILAATASVVAELSNTRWRSVAVSLTAGGYPIGAFVGGTVATYLLAGGWHSAFWIGAIATGALLPLVLLLVPETPAFLFRQAAPDAIARVNDVLARLGHIGLDVAPPEGAGSPRLGAGALLSGRLALVTVLLTIAYLAHVGTTYYILKWTPKIVVDLGFTPPAAARVLVWSSAGGAVGSIIFSLLTRRFQAIRAMLGTMALSSAGVIAFGLAPADLTILSAILFVTGFGVSATIVAFYAVLAQVLPVDVRATGIGLVVGIGRAGSAMSPILAGMLFARHFDRGIVGIIMASGSMIAFFCIILLLACRRRQLNEPVRASA